MTAAFKNNGGSQIDVLVGGIVIASFDSTGLAIGVKAASIDATKLATAVKPLGVGQTWQAVTRTIGVTYTNSTGRPILCSIGADLANANALLGVTTGGVSFYITGGSVAGYRSHGAVVIPDGATYVFFLSGGSGAIASATELR